MSEAVENTTYTPIDLAVNSVVKVFTASSKPSIVHPWQNWLQYESTGSGFVISGRKILTNAHVVADHTFVQVRKHGSPTKYKAKVGAIGHECDLAILEIDSETFWEGMNPLEFGDIPCLDEAVTVVGYPHGGDSVSITKGAVSRVEFTEYVHGATKLLAVQVSAAIDSGNSGGPAVIGNKIVGVVLADDINAGYISFEDLQVKTVNGVQVENLRHLYEMIENCCAEDLRLDLENDQVMVLNYKDAKEATSLILEHHRISSPISKDLLQSEEIVLASLFKDASL
ncbi:hypothetical protein AALP_AA6G135800 [Arabis alpina]|uniref:Protease Do-like PDZ domain-containing protein n=1 Tax=Arabis alpina TaxID=50452 RepID=A0A087GP11_ARAAL|nr:hypothetical protein AALP_AA6G135800 [Arabis alpina]